MLSLIDTHVHLLAGLDDGPDSLDESIAMCRALVSEGVSAATALAHQNDGYPDNLPQRLRSASLKLQTALKAEGIALAVHPTGEVMATADLPERLAQGRILTMADRGKYILVEMPHGLFLDLRNMAQAIRPSGVQIIVAHAERYPELLHDKGLAEQWIAAGCLIQVTACELAQPISANDARAMKDWARRGVIHMLGSDGHHVDFRPPSMRPGYEVLRKWVGQSHADRIAHIIPSSIFEGRTVTVPQPQLRSPSWFSWLTG